MKKNLLITGGTGFVGRNLKEALLDRYHVFAPSHAELDLLNFTALETYLQENKIKIVIHAAVHVPMVNGAAQELFNDLTMYANLDKLSSRVEKILYFGSGAEFDKRYDITLLPEAAVGRSVPNSEYGLAKYTMNQLARCSKNIYNLRLFGIFGKYELWQLKFLSNLCCKAVYDLPLTIRKDCYFDFLYVEDLPTIVTWFLEHTPQYHDYNVCSGEQYLLSEYAAFVQEISGKPLEVQMLSQGRALDYSASNERLRREIPDLKLTPIKTALQELYRYYSEHKDIIDFEILRNSR